MVKAHSKIMFVHGWGFGGAVWNMFIEQHFAEFPVDKVCFFSATSDLIDSVVGTEFLEETVIVAWSMGGLLGIEWALRQPDKIKALILLNSLPRFLTAPDWHYGLDKRQIEDLAYRAKKNMTKALAYFSCLIALGGPSKREAIRYLQGVAHAQSFSPSSLITGLDRLSNWDLRISFSQLNCPILVVLGDADRLVPAAASTALQALNPNIETVVLGSCSHAAFVNCPKQVADQIKGYL